MIPREYLTWPPQSVPSIGDIPKTYLRQAFNCGYLIVSQVNPHVTQSLYIYLIQICQVIPFHYPSKGNLLTDQLLIGLQVKLGLVHMAGDTVLEDGAGDTSWQ